MKNKINILNIPIDSLKSEDLDDLLLEIMERGKHQIIATVNSEFIVTAERDEDFKKILNKTALNLPDGIGILWAAKFMDSTSHIKSKPLSLIYWIFSLLSIPITRKWGPLPERISGADVIWQISRFAEKHNYKVFLLGGEPTIAERTALVLQTKIYGLKIVGVHSGTPADTEDIIRSINKSKADVIFVAFGSPKQEKWLSENLDKTSCKMGLGVGGSFDFISGTRKRAPKKIQNMGLEWLFRLIQEPSRIKRQLSLPIFAYFILKEQFKNINDNIQ